MSKIQNETRVIIGEVGALKNKSVVLKCFHATLEQARNIIDQPCYSIIR
jgi:hypothetical protein